MAPIGTAFTCVLMGAFCVPLAIAVVCDLCERRIPNGCTAVIALGGLLQMLGVVLMPEAPLAGLPPAGERLGCAAICVVGGVGSELLWRKRHENRHGMGMGDIKLLGAVALWIGFLVWAALAAACMLALVCEAPRGHRAFAFGPYIAVASVVCLVVGCL